MGNSLNPFKEQPPSFAYESLTTPLLISDTHEKEEAENENVRVFSVTELNKATKKFRKDRKVMGLDGSVRTFYKGKGYIDGTTFATSRTKTGIAVSVMECIYFRSQALQLQAWKEEVKSVGKICHPNLVKIFGYCCEDNKTLLVFEYLHRGSLDQHIFGKEKALPWETRIKIAIGTAQGLAFIHSIENSPLNRELRMHNIMLDEQYNAKLFYLESNQQYVVDKTIYGGEMIYMAPEFLISGHLGTENDVYTFGVILLELLAGSEDRARKLFKHSPDGWIRPFFIGEIIDPRLGNDYPVKAAIQLGTLIQSCTMLDKKKRPVMQHVLDVLYNIAEIEY